MLWLVILSSRQVCPAHRLPLQSLPRDRHDELVTPTFLLSEELQATSVHCGQLAWERKPVCLCRSCSNPHLWVVGRQTPRGQRLYLRSPSMFVSGLVSQLSCVQPQARAPWGGGRSSGGCPCSLTSRPSPRPHAGPELLCWFP